MTVNLINLIILGFITYIGAIILGPMVIEYFKKLSVRQVVREEGLESHHKKTGTPTMGGFIFLIPAIAITLIAAVIFDKFCMPLLVILLSTVLFGAIGFIDDYRKVIKKHNEGLTSREKLLAQLLVALPLAIYAYSINPFIWIPFTSIMLNVGLLKVLIVLFVVLATTNAVNLTDGVDGLSSSVTVLVLSFFVFIGTKLMMPYVSVYAMALIGGLLGFLMFNKYPAKIFMGDIGSLALGGAVVAFSIVTNTILLIPIVGVIYFAETLSVTLQVMYFKRTGKRIFKMSPLHHHYELSGWHENKIVRNFSIVTLIGVLIGVISIIGRL